MGIGFLQGMCLVRLQNLYLRNFRNYSSLELELNAGLTIFTGNNGQGKTNLLEAIHLLATTRTRRSIQDRDLINWTASAENLSAQVQASVSTDQEIKLVSVDLLQQSLGAGSSSAYQQSSRIQKRFTVHGIRKPASQYLGSLYVVMFDPEDLNLISGSPNARRRFLDILLCQIYPKYLKALLSYTKVLSQRNQLLKRIGDGLAKQEELAFWDQQLATSGATILKIRTDAAIDLSESLATFYHDLTSDSSGIELWYSTKVPPENYSDESLETNFKELLSTELPRQIALGATHIGPHRDDLLVYHRGQPMGPHSSRGEQRTAAIALRLSEAKMIEQSTLNRPIILLDDVFSELDTARRTHLMKALTHYDQVLVTTTEYLPIGSEPTSILKIDTGRITKF